MAIQIPNPGTGNGATGDNEFSLWSKVKANFENLTHAASRLVGNDAGNVPEITSTGIGTSGWAGTGKTTWDNTKTLQQFMPTRSIQVVTNTDKFSNDATLVAATGRSVYAGTFQNVSYDPNYFKCLYYPWRYEGLYVGTTNNSSDISWRQIIIDGANKIYETTTASGANVVVDAMGKLQRSTSSERYKDILADLELDDAAYANAMQLAPIVYRSTADADNPDYHYYSFSAEALGAFDPAFTLWRETEVVIDDEGNTIEQPLAERVAEGININALLAFSHAIAIKQDKMIKAQSDAIATLTQRINAMTAQ